MEKIEEDRKEPEPALIQSEILFEQFAENSSDVFWMVSSTEDRIIFLSSNFEKLWGINGADIHFSRSEWLKTVLEEDQKKVAEKLGINCPFNGPSFFDYRIQRPDGSIRWVRDHVFGVRNEKGDLYRIGGIARDITSEKLINIRRGLRHEVALMLAQYNTLEEFAPKLLEAVCKDLGWKLGIFWTVNPEINRASYFASWYAEDAALEQFVKNSKGLFFESNKGFVGKILAGKEALFVKAVVEEAYFLQKEDARRANLKDAVGFPIFLRGQNYGVIEFLNPSIDIVDSAWLDFFNDIAKQMGLFIERKIAEKALLESEERFRKTFENAAIGIALMTIEGQIFQVNNSLCDMLGFTKEELTKKNFKELTFKEDLIKESIYQRQVLTGELEIYHTDKRFVTKDKSLIWASISSHLLRDAHNNPLYFIYEIEDISQRKHTEEKLFHLAYYDLLTGLPNKRLAESTLNQSLLSASLSGDKMAVFFININRFRLINDTAGAEIGDQILKQVAFRLSERVQIKDLLGRWEGDEFILLLSNIRTKEAASLFAKKLLSLIKEPFHLEERTFFLTASIGISIFPDDASEMQTLIKKAHTSMNLAKKEGMDNYQFYTEELANQTQEKIAVELNLRKALSRNEFTLHFQPIFDLISGQATCAEALIRWTSAELGAMAPVKFIPIAEESGLILPIGEWVIREGCRAAKQFEKEGHSLLVAVNISAIQLKDAEFVQRVTQILKDEQLDPKLLRFEITESHLMENRTDTFEKISKLQQLGIQFAIDDFGTGYSSFSYLKNFSFDRFKIDASFIHNLAHDEKNKIIVEGIIAMSKALKIPSIAEGVETKEEVEILKQIGCPEVQGFYFSPPVPFEKLKQIIFKN